MLAVLARLAWRLTRSRPAWPATMTRRVLVSALALCAGAVGLLAGPFALTAHAEGTASTFVVAANLAKEMDGVDGKFDQFFSEKPGSGD